MSAPTAVQLLQKASGKFTPILQQWLAFKSAVAILVCALFGIYFGIQLTTPAPDRTPSSIGAAAAIVGLIASVQSVWSLWGRRRIPPLPFAIIAAASSPLLIGYWVWTAFLAG